MALATSNDRMPTLPSSAASPPLACGAGSTFLDEDDEVAMESTLCTSGSATIAPTNSSSSSRLKDFASPQLPKNHEKKEAKTFAKKNLGFCGEIELGDQPRRGFELEHSDFVSDQLAGTEPGRQELQQEGGGING
uniref:Uncharacterized protein n=1 Tax=Arundo donax TaxID=35708 RepID=A0A0A9EHY6_ARUDO